MLRQPVVVLLLMFAKMLGYCNNYRVWCCFFVMLYLHIKVNDDWFN